MKNKIFHSASLCLRYRHKLGWAKKHCRNELNVSIELMNKIRAAFCKLEEEGDLVQGKGYFDFGEFQIHI